MISWADMVDEDEERDAERAKERNEERSKERNELNKCIDCNKIIANKKHKKCIDCFRKCKNHKLINCWRCSVPKTQKKSKQYINNDNPKRKWRRKIVHGKSSSGVSHHSKQPKTQITVQHDDIELGTTENIVEEGANKS